MYAYLFLNYWHLDSTHCTDQSNNKVNKGCGLRWVVISNTVKKDHLVMFPTLRRNSCGVMEHSYCMSNSYLVFWSPMHSKYLLHTQDIFSSLWHRLHKFLELYWRNESHLSKRYHYTFYDDGEGERSQSKISHWCTLGLRSDDWWGLSIRVT